MKTLMHSFLIGLLVLLVICGISNAFGALPQERQLPFSVTTSLPKKSFTLGEEIRYRLLVFTTKDTEIEFSDNDIPGSALALEDSGQSVRNLWGKKKVSRWYVFVAYATGSVKIPKVTIRYKQKNDVDWSYYPVPEQSLQIQSLLDKASSQDSLRDIKPPLGLVSRTPIFLLIILLALCGVFGFFAYRNFIRKKPYLQARKVRPAHEIAYEQLRALRRKDLINRGMIKEYFIEISDILRRYLENRFEFRAPEMTTEEFLANLRDSAQLIKSNKDLLKEFLVCCDLVKFAKYAPSSREIDSVYESAKKVIDQTKEEVKSDIS